jgi:hypothetical protein
MLLYYLQGVLSAADADSGNDEEEVVEKSSYASTLTSGMAWMYMNRDGSLVYSVQLDELNQDAPMLVLVSSHRGGGRRSMLELEDLTPSLNHGWANGVSLLVCMSSLRSLRQFVINTMCSEMYRVALMLMERAASRQSYNKK